MLTLCFILFAQVWYFGESCAPYFRTVLWKSKEERMKSSANCDPAYNDPNLNRISVTGEDYCTNLFAGKAFCYFQCNSPLSPYSKTCKGQKTTVGVQCSQFRKVGEGNLPDQLFFTCKCRYNGAGGPSECQTNEFVWTDAENLRDMYCSGGAFLRRIQNGDSSGSSSSSSDINFRNGGSGSANNDNLISESDNEQQIVHRMNNTVIKNSTVYLIMMPNRQQQQDQTVLPSVAPPVVSHEPYPDSLDPVAPMRPPSRVPVVVVTTPIDENTPRPRSNLLVNPNDFVL